MRRRPRSPDWNPVSFDAAETVSRFAVNPSGTHSASEIWRVQIERLLPVVVSVWLVGVGFFVARLAAGWWHVRRLYKSTLRSPGSHLQQMADVVAERIGLRRLVHIVDSDLLDTPTALGWIRPVVLVPVAVVAQLTPMQVEAILAHELSHIQRHDYLVNLIQSVCEVFFFYHPAVWWLSARIRSEREHCCDDTAVKVCGDAVLYVKALKQLEEARKPAAERSQQSRLVFAATGGSLVGRVRRLLRVDGDTQRTSSSAVLTIALLAALVVFVAGRDRLKAMSLSSVVTVHSAAESTFGSASIKAVPTLTPQSPGFMCGFGNGGAFKAFGTADLDHRLRVWNSHQPHATAGCRWAGLADG